MRTASIEHAQLPHRGRDRRARRQRDHGPDRRRRRRGRHRLRDLDLPRRLDRREQFDRRIRTAISASPSSSTSSTARRCPTTTTATGRTSPASSAGNGKDSAGSASKAGMAPKASIVALKVLDADGAGTIADIIEALNWVYVNRAAYNIRVVNLSVGAPVRESYWTDPLTLATKKLTDQGIVVVVAAGNLVGTQRSTATAAIRRDHGARQRPLGADRRRVEHARHVDAQRRHHRELQLAWADVPRLGRETGPRRARHRHRLARGARQQRSTRPSRRRCSADWSSRGGRSRISR